MKSHVVERYVAHYRSFKNPKHRQELVNEKNYIQEPKTDGYRCYHLNFKYHADSPQRKVYNNLRIEIQLRSRLQHIWATAVERKELCLMLDWLTWNAIPMINLPGRRFKARLERLTR